MIEIDWLPAERIPELQEFVDRRWRRGHVFAGDEELLRWQHRRRSEDGRLAVLVAEEGGAFVGMLGFVEFDACLGDERASGGWMTNWLVVPEARGRGLGMALVERALGGEYEFVGALDANDATRHVLGAHGFAERMMTRWVRVFDAEGLRELLGSDRRLEARPISDLRPSAGPPLGGCRDESFLRWRYDEHPRFRYEILRGSGFAAYRIEQVRDSPARVMRIVDFLGGSELAEALAEAAERERVVFADFSCTAAPFGAELERAGFERDERLPRRFQPLDFSDRPPVCCFWAAARLAVDFASDDLYVTRADSDLDRPN